MIYDLRMSLWPFSDERGWGWGGGGEGGPVNPRAVAT